MTETNRPVSEGAESLIGKYFPVLDHGFVSLVDYLGTDQCIERAARVSYGAGTRKVSETRGLIRYLRRHKHTTPTEMLELKFHCCMPMFIARQWIRHRTANVNEYSGRYSLLPMLFYTPPKEQFSKQSKTNNQGRSDKVEEHMYSAAVERWNTLRKDSQQLYEDLTNEDIARELARIDLPLSTYTQWYWKIDLHNLLHFLTLRVDSHAQWEIRQYGEVMAGMLKLIAPLSYEAWIDYDVCGARMSRMELEILRDMLEENRYLCMAKEQQAQEFAEFGLSSRETDEFLSKLEKKSTVDFKLDLSVAQSPDFFEKQMIAAVPKIDVK